METALSQWLFGISVGSFTLTAAIWDLKTRRIPNWLNVLALVLAVVWQCAFFGWTGLGHAGAGFAAGFVPLLIAWLLGGNGAGDAKLLGALGAWFGLTMTLLVLVGSVGLLLCFQISVWFYRMSTGRRSPPRRNSDRKTADPQRLVPFAVPVLVAAWGVGALNIIRLG